jgi:hypothetical protein
MATLAPHRGNVAIDLERAGSAVIGDAWAAGLGLADVVLGGSVDAAAALQPRGLGRHQRASSGSELRWSGQRLFGAPGPFVTSQRSSSRATPPS